MVSRWIFCNLLLSVFAICSAEIDLSQTPPDVSNHTNLHLLPSECGTFSSDERIFGGTNASLFEFPWMALLYYKTKKGYEFHCGGTIINEKYILTAAHCLTGPKLSGITLTAVRIGEHVISTVEDCEEFADIRICAPPVQDLVIEEIIPHEDYNFTTFVNDIGLLRVQTMNLTADNAEPVCLPLHGEENANITDKYVTVTGYGLTENRKYSQALLKVFLRTLPNKDCKDKFSKSAKITSRHLCAGGDSGKDSCKGDSGGPLQTVAYINGEQKYVQHGIVSFGSVFCGKGYFPGVYTRVSYYMDWILDNMRP